MTLQQQQPLDLQGSPQGLFEVSSSIILGTSLGNYENSYHPGREQRDHMSARHPSSEFTVAHGPTQPSCFDEEHKLFCSNQEFFKKQPVGRGL